MNPQHFYEANNSIFESLQFYETELNFLFFHNSQPSGINNSLDWSELPGIITPFLILHSNMKEGGMEGFVSCSARDFVLCRWRSSAFIILECYPNWWQLRLNYFEELILVAKRVNFCSPNFHLSSASSMLNNTLTVSGRRGQWKIQP